MSTQRINLVKYGFVRCPNEDFSDDGNRFTCYKVGNVRVSKLVYNGEAYIDGRIDDGKLSYNQYKTLPHYQAIGELNGVSVNTIYDKDLIDLYNACVAYDREYTELVAHTKFPTLDELKEQERKIHIVRSNEATQIKARINSEIFKLPDYELIELKRYYNVILDNIKLKDFSRMLNTSASIDYISSANSEFEPSFYFTQSMKILDNIK